jgi:hypothetical protein
MSDNIQTTVDPTATLLDFEQQITDSEGSGLRARWESGRAMLGLRPEGKKQLPNGKLAELSAALGVHQSELTARMKFAARYPTEAEVTTAMSKFGSWFAIRKAGLKDGERKPKAPAANSGVKPAVRAILDVDPAELTRDGLKRIEDAVAELRRKMDYLLADHQEAA